jgi:translin
MQQLDELTQRIHEAFDNRTRKRDEILAQSRLLTRYCAHAIRAVHREETEQAEQQLAEGRKLVQQFRLLADEYADLYYAGYTQDSLKEFAEASLVFALINNQSLPSPEDLFVEYATYLQGLAEAVGELRRRCLDLLLHRRSQEAERLLEHMDDIYDILVTMDYPDAITGGLRRLTDVARSIIERTRGDLTMSLRQEALEESLRKYETNQGKSAAA